MPISPSHNSYVCRTLCPRWWYSGQNTNQYFVSWYSFRTQSSPMRHGPCQKDHHHHNHHHCQRHSVSGNPNHWQIFPHNKENTRPHKEGGLLNPTTLRQFSHFLLVIGFWVVIKLVILMMSETSQITGIWWCKFTDISNLQILLSVNSHVNLYLQLLDTPHHHYHWALMSSSLSEFWFSSLWSDGTHVCTGQMYL